MTTNSSVRFTLDVFKKTISGTKASFDKASKGEGPIYEELARKMAAHPDYKLVIKEQKIKKEINKANYGKAVAKVSVVSKQSNPVEIKAVANF